MDPEQVGKTYKKQAEALKAFLDKLQTEKYTNEEYKLIVITKRIKWEIQLKFIKCIKWIRKQKNIKKYY